MSVYACIYAKLVQAGKPTIFSSLVGVKGFIQTKDSQGPFPTVTIVNNPGQHVYPGGKGDVTKIDEALREFYEETGIQFIPGKLPNTVTSGGSTFPVVFEPLSPYYSCAFIRISSVQLTKLQTAIKTNITNKTTVSDELRDVKVIELTEYDSQLPSAKITNFCKTNSAILSKSQSLADWTKFLKGNLPNLTPTTQDELGGAKLRGVAEFYKECWDMGPFMGFIAAAGPKPTFDFPGKTYAFLSAKEANKGALPSRFATDWFSQMSESISAVDLKMPQ